MSKDKGVTISGSINHVGGDIVGGDLIIGGGGQVACDFVYKGVVFKGLCYPDDQAAIQKQIDKFIDGKIDADVLLSRVGSLAPNMTDTLRRMIQGRA